MPKPFASAIKRAPRSDPQRNRLYRMEKEAIGGRQIMKMTQDEVRKFVRAIARAFKMREPLVRFADLGEWAGAWQNGVIALNTRPRPTDMLTVAHEMAHELHEQLAPGNEHQDHGPQFMCCYMSILDATRLIPVVAMRAILKQYKLNWIDPGVNTTLTTMKQRLHNAKVRDR